MIAAFAALWIAAHEFSPLKPYPNFHRYMVPAAPLLVILGMALIYQLAERLLPRWSGAIAATSILLAGLPALHASYRIAGPPGEDLRAIVPPILLADTPTPPSTAIPASKSAISTRRTAGPRLRAPISWSRRAWFTAAMASLPRARCNPHEIRGRAARYADLFRRPYLELSNGRPPFAFFNPVFRIVALDGDQAHLESLAASLRAEHPDLSLRLVNTD